MSPEAADLWQDEIHEERRTKNDDWSSDFYEGFEGVGRTITGPPPLNFQTGETPSWWSPPGLPFRATELMVWYKNHDSGIGQASYSTYDESTNELWIYEYSSQHDILWSGGEPPIGDRFGSIELDETLD